MDFKVGGMSCAACAARVEKAVRLLGGVDCCSVNLLTGSMRVSGEVSPEAVISAVEAAGYHATKKDAFEIQDSSSESEKREALSLLGRLISSLALLLPLMYLSMGHLMWGWYLPRALSLRPLLLALIELLLTAAVLLINRRFFVSGFRAVLHRSPNMDTLVSLGAGASFLYSVALIFRIFGSDAVHANHLLHGLYFESAAMIVTLITLGKLLEAKAKGRSTDAIRELMQMAPKRATVLRDGKEISLAAEEVRVGDIFVVKAGERFPVDGRVIWGSGAVDESALTGESIPTDKQVGDEVYASTVNGHGVFHCEATKVGEDTTLYAIIRLVREASATKAPIAKLADRVSGVFVPLVMGVAVLSFAIWMLAGENMGFALARGISVLVISCPCALGLATPVAIMVGSGVGARRGILFKNAEALEMTGRIKTVALDKTGTLTVGSPEVVSLHSAEGVEEIQLLEAACSLERNSEHPLARAVLRFCEGREVLSSSVNTVEIHPGGGLTASLDGKLLVGGSLSFVSRFTALTDDISSLWQVLANAGQTPILFSCDGRYLGMLGIADELREDSCEAVREMKRMGIRVVMITGDNQKTAAAIASRAGIDDVYAEVLPTGKEELVRTLSVSGGVCMVGDGINDAPALTRADVGMAIGAGSEIALDSANVVLMRNSLSDVVTAIRLSRATLRNIRENLFWAFAYNTLGIPLAAGMLIPLFGWELNPMFGAAAMSLSSVCVVTNALRLNLFERKKSKRKEMKKMKKVIKIEGMMCPHCEARVKTLLEAMDGVASADVSHKKGSASITCTEEVSDDALREVIEGAGYRIL